MEEDKKMKNLKDDDKDLLLSYIDSGELVNAWIDDNGEINLSKQRQEKIIKEIKEKEKIRNRYIEKYKYINFSQKFNLDFFIEVSEYLDCDLFQEDLEYCEIYKKNKNKNYKYFKTRSFSISFFIEKEVTSEYYRTLNAYHIGDINNIDSLIYRMIDTLNTLLKKEDSELKDLYLMKYGI